MTGDALGENTAANEWYPSPWGQVGTALGDTGLSCHTLSVQGLSVGGKPSEGRNTVSLQPQCGAVTDTHVGGARQMCLNALRVNELPQEPCYPVSPPALRKIPCPTSSWEASHALTLHLGPLSLQHGYPWREYLVGLCPSPEVLRASPTAILLP